MRGFGCRGLVGGGGGIRCIFFLICSSKGSAEPTDAPPFTLLNYNNIDTMNYATFQTPFLYKFVVKLLIGGHPAIHPFITKNVGLHTSLIRLIKSGQPTHIIYSHVYSILKDINNCIHKCAS